MQCPFPGMDPYIEMCGLWDLGAVETEVAVELEFREKFLDIREMRSGAIVTTIEVLSPSNKRRGEGRQQYLLKRNACLLGERNFIEIDLLRRGTRMPLASEYPVGEYFVALFRMTRPGKCGLWPIGLRDPLPVVPVPLMPGEPEMRLDLAPMVNAIYIGSNYGLSINYALHLSPPLKSQEDTDWMNQWLRSSTTK